VQEYCLKRSTLRNPASLALVSVLACAASL
jgi:hypothetical protein